MSNQPDDGRGVYISSISVRFYSNLLSINLASYNLVLFLVFKLADYSVFSLRNVLNSIYPFFCAKTLIFLTF